MDSERTAELRKVALECECYVYDIITELLDHIESQDIEIERFKVGCFIRADDGDPLKVCVVMDENITLRTDVERKHDLLLKISYCGDVMEAMYNNHEPLRDEFDKELEAKP